jgi:type I restriction enzyme S subunit
MTSALLIIPVGYKQTEIGVIPEDWEVKCIGEIARVIGGGTPSTQVSNYWGGEINWFTPTEVGSTKYLSESVRKITESGLQNSSASLLPVGTILLTSRAGIGDLGILRIPACTNQGFQSMVCNDNVKNQFLYYIMITKRRELERRGSGSTFLEISPNEVKAMQISVPSQKEQNAITGVLSEIDSQIQALESLMAKKQDIKQGMMQELLTGKTRLSGYSGEWDERKIGEIADLYQPETISAAQMKSNGYTVFGANGIVGFYDRFNHKSWQTIITCRGSTCGTVNRTIDEVWITGNAMVANVDNNQEVNKLFFYYLLTYQDFTICITGTGQPQIVRSPLENFTVELPPTLAEQETIAEVLSDMDAEIAALEQRLEKTKAIKQGMMQQLLTGRIRLVDSSTPQEARV